MGTAQFKSKSKNTNSLIQPPKVSISVEINTEKAIPLQLMQLTKWSLSEVKNLYQTFQRIAQSPILDNFLFKKIMPLSKKHCQIMFNVLTKNGKFLSVYELICVLVLGSYQTYRKKFQFLTLIFDFEHKGYINGKQFILIFYSMLYGYCRLTDQQSPNFDTVERYAQASLFPGEDDYETKSIGLRKFIQQYDGNSNISHIFNRFEHIELKQIKEDPLIYALSQFQKYSPEDFVKFYRILCKIYSKKDYEEVYLIEQNKQLRRQNRRDSCFRNLIEQKNVITYEKYDSPFRIKKSQSLAKINHFHQSQRLNKHETPKMLEKQREEQQKNSFKIRKMHSIISVPNSMTNSISNSRSQSTSKIKLPPAKTSKLIFLNGHTHSKNEIFETINYFKSFSDNEQKVNIKDFFKKFDKDVFLKKQLSSIFKYLDYGNKGQITIEGFFKSFYPGIKQKDLKVLEKWYSQYQEIYQADSLKRNRAKVIVMGDARVLPIDTLERMREIFRAIDNGNKGFINFEDLRKSYKHGFTVDELENILKQYGDGEKIKINGLCRMLLPMGWTIQGVDLNNLQK